MKKNIVSSFFGTMAALAALAASASAGTITLNDLTFTPPDAFTVNSIMADIISGNGGDTLRISGSATVVPPDSNTATIQADGGFTANAGDIGSLVYSFTVDSNTENPVQYVVSGSITVPPLPPVPFQTSGTIDPGLNRYEGTVDTSGVSFPPGVTGSFTASLDLNFSPIGASGSPSAASGTLDLAIQQIDFQLSPTAETLPPPSQSENLSTRGNVGTDEDVLIGGFIITGTEPKLVAIRALGPSLANATPAVPDDLADPLLELHDKAGDLITTNDSWMDNSTDNQTIITDNGLDLYNGLPINNDEPIIVMTLDPGEYTAVVRGSDGGTGVALVEIYDLDTTTDGQLANISTRGDVGTGDNILDGGFILGPDGNGTAEVIVRALGPSLADRGVTNPLADPTLSLMNKDGDVVATNDNWGDDPNSQKVIDAGLAPDDPNESAIYAIPGPGEYTAIVSGANDSTGVALVEIYNLDSAQPAPAK